MSLEGNVIMEKNTQTFLEYYVSIYERPKQETQYIYR